MREKLMGLKAAENRDRHFKTGDVIRWVPSYQTIEQVRARGLGIVVESKGPKFKAYWIGDNEVRRHDNRPSGQYLLQDYAPIPQVADWLEARHD